MPHTLENCPGLRGLTMHHISNMKRFITCLPSQNTVVAQEIIAEFFFDNSATFIISLGQEFIIL